MDRINGQRTVDIGSGRRGFRKKDAAVGVAGTELTPLWFNAVQEELLYLIEQAELVPAANDWTQIKAAITTMIDRAIAAGLVVASAAEIQTGTATKLVRVDRLWSAGTLVALTDAASIALNLSTGINFSVTLAGNRTLVNPTNVKVGQSGVIIVTQDATGGRTLSFGSNWKFSRGIVPAINPAAGSVTVIYYYALSATQVLAAMSKAIA
jgi:hypothetical protein